MNKNLIRGIQQAVNVSPLNTFGVATSLLALAISAQTLAGSREEAKTIHERIAGVPPSAQVLDQMTSLIESGQSVDAAYVAMNNPSFYNIVLKNFVTPWTNEDQTVFDELNDYSATVIGMVRDDVPFNTVLSADVVYVGSDNAVQVPYSHSDNEHYRQLELQNVDLSDPAMLVPVTQSGLPDSQLQSKDAAGVITTRAAGKAFFSAGTNRAMLRFTAMAYLCRDMEDLKDITLNADRVRQDVTRSPGGDSSLYLNHCVGCHSGMDPMAGAYAYYDFDEELGRLVYTDGQVQPKYLINSGTFSPGHVTESDRWDNYWREGAHSILGWKGEVSGGNGAKSMGRELANSRAFAVCQVEKVFEEVCLHSAETTADKMKVEEIADVFVSNSYSLKRVFAETASYCASE